MGRTGWLPPHIHPALRIQPLSLEGPKLLPTEPPGAQLGLHGHGMAMVGSPWLLPSTRRGLPWLTCSPGLGRLSGVGHPWGAPVPRGAGGHAGGTAGCPSLCCAVCARSRSPTAGSKVPGRGRAGGGRRRGQEPEPEPTASLPTSLPASLPAPGAACGAQPRCAPILSITLAGFGLSAAPQTWDVWASPMRSQPFPHGRQGPLAKGTMVSRLWGPQSLTYEAHGPSTMGAIAPHPWGLQPPAHGNSPLAHPRAASLPHWGHAGPGSARTPGCCPAGTPALRGNPGDKGGHCHLEASLGIVSPKPGPPRVSQQLGPC